MTGSSERSRRRRRALARAGVAAAVAAWTAGCGVGRPSRSGPAAVPVATALPGSSACQRAGQFWLRASAASYMVVELVPDSIVAVPAAAGAPDGSTERGRLARLVRAGGDTAATSAAAAGTPEAVLVFWGTVGDCRPSALPPDALATQPGERVFVSGMLRPRERWAGGRPTMDVYATPHLYVPSRERARWAGTSDSIPSGAELMTAEEYLTFYEALPTREQWDNHSAFARRRLRRWLRANAALVAKEPGARIIRDMNGGTRRKY